MYRGLLWEEYGPDITPSATLTETLRPLPSPPPSAFKDRDALETIAERPDLFQVHTPINVDLFERLLADHPNQPLVQSVVRGLREGFWPFADAEGLEVPSTWEEERRFELDAEQAAFIAQYAEDEERAGRYSAPFGRDLLKGMVCMPIYAVPKPRSEKLRLINNHSAGPWALNSLIDKGKVGMRPDNVQDLGRNLLNFRQVHGDAPVWLFKSDVKNAYRLLPIIWKKQN